MNAIGIFSSVFITFLVAVGFAAFLLVIATMLILALSWTELSDVQNQYVVSRRPHRK